LKRTRIGNGCGFWGDNLEAPIILAERGNIDYLTLEYLAELTMSILALQKQRNPEAGFATDFLDVLERLCPILKSRATLKVITNAGGMNPAACATRSQEILRKAGLADRRIGIVSGDDLMPRLDQLLEEGHALANLDTNQPLSSNRSQVVSANAYLGARPIETALKQGATIVITGRVADASLTVGPAVHELGWSWSDTNRLAAATVAGHLIECGAQATGGLWCNWQQTADFANVGYPIADIAEDGTFDITKPDGTGGAVNCETVSEQLLYEVGDPRAYLTPDVVADFTSLHLTQAKPDQVSVVGARGKPATDTYKVSIAYRAGFSASGTLLVMGPDCVTKAQRCGQMILERVQRAGFHLQHTNIECLGAGDSVPGALKMKQGLPEVVLRVAARDARRHAIERFTKEFAPLVTSGPPGVTGYATGRPSVREVFAFWPALLSKTAIVPDVKII
jgi:hypothetical protein